MAVFKPPKQAGVFHDYCNQCHYHISLNNLAQDNYFGTTGSEDREGLFKEYLCRRGEWIFFQFFCA
jgi:hypothetical protein